MFVKYNAHEVAETKVRYFTDIPDLSSGSVFELAPFSDDDGACD